MLITIRYNDGALERTNVADETVQFEVSNELKAFREVIDVQGNGWEVAEDIINDENDDDSYELEDISDQMLQEYIDKKFNGDWTQAMNHWLDEVDISGDRYIMFVMVDNKVVRDE